MKKNDLQDLFCLQAQYQGKRAWLEDHKPKSEDIAVIDAEINFIEQLVVEHLERYEPKP